MEYKAPQPNQKENLQKNIDYDQAKKIAADAYHAFADKIYQDDNGVWRSKTTDLPIEDIDNLYKKNDDISDKRMSRFND